MLRIVLACIAGVATAFLTVFLIELAGHTIWPAPGTPDTSSPEALRAFMASLPPGALASVAVAWVAGAYAGSRTGFLLGKSRIPAYTTGGLVTLASVSNLLLLPHPVWFWPVALVLVPAATWLACRRR